MNPWFGTKRYGWVLYPLRWQGWLITFVFAILFIKIFFIIDFRSHSTSDSLIAFFAPNGTVVLLAFLLIVYLIGKRQISARVEDTAQTRRQKISIDEFQKTDLRIAEVTHAERVPHSEKLLRLKLILGNEQRQILAGIGKAYTPEDMIGKKIVIVANLEPRKLMGLESNGMLLAAHDKKPVLLIPEKAVPSGSSIG